MGAKSNTKTGVPGGAKQKKKPVEKTIEEIREEQKERLDLAGVEFQPKELEQYFKAPDDQGVVLETVELGAGFKRCGRCKHVKKLYLFNKNSGSKLHATGNCKQCQRESAAASYKKTKKRRNYKKYYEQNKEMKQEQARRYYAENKERMDAKHAEYLKTKAGKKVMKRAQEKRAKAIANNKGIPYTRAMVLDRDCKGGDFPICYLCGKPINDVSGESCHLDHVVSINNGGLDCFTNIAAVHKTCNLTKTKDDRDVDPLKVTGVIKLAESYMDAHPECFDDED